MRKVFLALVLCLFATTLYADNPKTVKVAICRSDPFVEQTAGLSGPIGFDIELWKLIAADLNLNTEFVTVSRFKDLFPTVERGHADIAMAGITITEPRETVFNFSHPYMKAGLTIMLRPDQQEESLFSSLAGTMASNHVLTMGLVLLLIVVISGVIMWLSEQGSDAIADDHRSGILEGCWWAIVTATTVGYGDKVPNKWYSKVLAVIVMIAGITMFSVFTASLSSSMTLQKISEINSIQDLKSDTRVGTVSKTTSEEFLANYPGETGQIRPFDTVEEAVVALTKKEIDCVIFDAPILQHMAKHQPEKLCTIDQVFDPQSYGVLLRIDFDLRKQINRAILKLEKNGKLQALKKKYFE